MDQSREFELKLDVDPATTRGLRERLLRRINGGVRETLTSIYFDSKNLSLKKKGLSLRVRIQGDRRIQTLKGSSKGGAGLFDRLEWNAEVKEDKPDLSGIEHTPFHSVLSPKRLRGRLKPVFTTEMDRTTWNIRSDEAEIELSLDEGRVVADGRTEAVAELELELKSGMRSELFKLARSLSPAVAFKIGVLTKAERGYALVAGSAPSSFKAGPLALEPTMTASDAFGLIVRACIRHFRLNERLLIETRSAESLHQSRVALRRLRSALSLFKDIVEDREIGKLKGGLRRIWQRLGEARDLDVFLADLKGRCARAETDEEGAELIKRLQKDRDQAYDRVAAALQERRFRRLMLDLLAWSEAGPWLSADDPRRQARRNEPLESFAAEVLAQRRRKVRRRGRNLDKLDAPTQHQVRIEAKKLRYATEFFSALATTNKARRRHATFLKTLEGLQEHLGRLNDLVTGDKMAKQQPQQAMPSVDVSDAPGAAGGQIPEESREIKKSLAAASGAFREFVKAKPFWRAATIVDQDASSKKASSR